MLTPTSHEEEKTDCYGGPLPRAKIRRARNAYGPRTKNEQTIQRAKPRGIQCQTPVVRMLMRAIGSMNLQAKSISWSIRSRGRVPRTQMNIAISARSLVKNQ